MPRPSRRAEVCATAARLFREYGYSSATMDLIADEVGLNKGTLYHYYPAKSAILFELLSNQADATLELIGRVPADGTAGMRMRELIRLQVAHVSDSTTRSSCSSRNCPGRRSTCRPSRRLTCAAASAAPSTSPSSC